METAANTRDRLIGRNLIDNWEMDVHGVVDLVQDAAAAVLAR